MSIEPKQESNPFDALAGRYDAWFETPKGRAIFNVEIHALRELLERIEHPWLEVGVGSGRFAHALGVDEGVDPSNAILKIAAGRGINARAGYGEDLPYPDSTYGALLLVVTICFLTDPQKALREAARVLRSDGRLIVGLVPKDSSWGKLYALKGKDGHPFYSPATFYMCEEVIAMAWNESFEFEMARSCLVESPESEVPVYAETREGIIPDAGFVAMRFKFGG